MTTDTDTLREAAETLRKEAFLLLQNSEGCALNHYGNDHELFGMPGWLADSRQRIEGAAAALATLTKPEPAAEPVAWIYEGPGYGPAAFMNRHIDLDEGWTETPLYASPVPSGGADEEETFRAYVLKAADRLAPHSGDAPGTPTRDALVWLNAALFPKAREKVPLTYVPPSPSSEAISPPDARAVVEAVTQEDRKAAALVWFNGGTGPNVTRMLSGMDDDHIAVQAFAAHRLAALQSGASKEGGQK